jgi:hypothetical protein
MNVILNIGGTKFIMELQEAMDTARTLNSCMRVETTWLDGVKTPTNHVMEPPAATAHITPLTAIFQMELDSNTKLKAEKAR